MRRKVGNIALFLWLSAALPAWVLGQDHEEQNQQAPPEPALPALSESAEGGRVEGSEVEGPALEPLQGLPTVEELIQAYRAERSKNEELLRRIAELEEVIHSDAGPLSEKVEELFRELQETRRQVKTLDGALLSAEDQVTRLRAIPVELQEQFERLGAALLAEQEKSTRWQLEVQRIGNLLEEERSNAKIVEEAAQADRTQLKELAVRAAGLFEQLSAVRAELETLEGTVDEMKREKKRLQEDAVEWASRAHETGAREADRLRNEKAAADQEASELRKALQEERLRQRIAEQALAAAREEAEALRQQGIHSDAGPLSKKVEELLRELQEMRHQVKTLDGALLSAEDQMKALEARDASQTESSRLALELAQKEQESSARLPAALEQIEKLREEKAALHARRLAESVRADEWQQRASEGNTQLHEERAKAELGQQDLQLERQKRENAEKSAASLSGELARSQEQMQSIERKLQNSQAARDGLEAQISQHAQQLSRKEKELSDRLYKADKEVQEVREARIAAEEFARMWQRKAADVESALQDSQKELAAAENRTRQIQEASDWVTTERRRAARLEELLLAAEQKQQGATAEAMRLGEELQRSESRGEELSRSLAALERAKEYWDKDAREAADALEEADEARELERRRSEELSATVQRLSQALEETAGQENTAKDFLARLQSERKSWERKANDLSKELEIANAALKDEQSRASELQEQIAPASRELRSAHVRLNALEETLSAMELERAAAVSRADELARGMKQVQDSVSLEGHQTKGLEEQLRTLTGALSEAEAHVRTLQKNAAASDLERAGLQAMLDELSRQQSRRQGSLSKEIEEARLREKALRESLLASELELKRQSQALETTVAQAQAKVSDLESSLRSAQQEKMKWQTLASQLTIVLEELGKPLPEGMPLDPPAGGLPDEKPREPSSPETPPAGGSGTGSPAKEKPGRPGYGSS